jgi:hypothetical protein
MSLYEELLSCLASDRREKFLAALAHQLTVSARASYVEAGCDERDAATGMRCHNEILHVVTAQQQADAGLGVGYPDDAFIHSLTSKSEAFGQCGDGLRWSIHQALQRASSNSSSLVP